MPDPWASGTISVSPDPLASGTDSVSPEPLASGAISAPTEPLPGAPTVGVWTRGPGTNKWWVFMSPLTRMVMQENTEDLYWFGSWMPYVQWESWSLCCLAPESACSRVIAREGYVSGLDLGREWREAQCSESPFSTWVEWSVCCSCGLLLCLVFDDV